MGFKNKDKFLKRLNGLTSPQAIRKIEQALLTGAELIANTAAISITTGGGQGINHVVSLPGQTPNSDLGTLDGSIEAVKFGRLKVRVLVNADHAIPLEFGTSKMAARPFLRPARDKKKDEVRDLVVKAINEITRGK